MVFAEMDRWIVDGIVNGLRACIGRTFAWISGAIDKYIVDGAVNFVASALSNAGNKLRGMQTGQRPELRLRDPRGRGVPRHHSILPRMNLSDCAPPEGRSTDTSNTMLSPDSRFRNLRLNGLRSFVATGRQRGRRHRRARGDVHGGHARDGQRRFGPRG